MGTTSGDNPMELKLRLDFAGLASPSVIVISSTCGFEMLTADNLRLSRPSRVAKLVGFGGRDLARGPFKR